MLDCAVLWTIHAYFVSPVSSASDEPPFFDSIHRIRSLIHRINHFKRPIHSLLLSYSSISEKHSTILCYQHDSPPNYFFTLAGPANVHPPIFLSLPNRHHHDLQLFLSFSLLAFATNTPISILLLVYSTTATAFYPLPPCFPCAWTCVWAWAWTA